MNTYENKETGVFAFDGRVWNLSWEEAAKTLFEGNSIVVKDYDDYDEDEKCFTFGDSYVLTPEQIPAEYKETVERVQQWIGGYESFSSDLTMAS